MSVENNEEFMHLEPEKIADFIFSQLLAEGIVIKREDIVLILELEMEYMLKNGIGMVVYDEIDDD